MGRNIGIVIGINGYTNMPNLAYAERDAALIRQYFEQAIQFDQVYHFAPDVPDIPADRGPAIPSTPSYANLRRFFRVRFEHPFLAGGDNVWFFFAGHGLRHQERDYTRHFHLTRGCG
ncbi:MAG: caspase family protein [Cyanothece sp. SIO2G6]|nr:caspase family protein [Cyanothece sp. SIO2G6]